MSQKRHKRRRQAERAGLDAVTPYLVQSVTETECVAAGSVPEVVALTGVTPAPAGPILTSRIVYDLIDGSADCYVELRSGVKANLTINANQLRQPLGEALMRRVMRVHTALLLWGVGDPAWHRRDVGKAACLLLAMMLPYDDAQFVDALTSPEQAGHFLTAGGHATP